MEEGTDILSLNCISVQVMNFEPTFSSESFDIQVIRNGFEVSGPGNTRCYFLIQHQLAR